MIRILSAFFMLFLMGASAQAVIDVYEFEDEVERQRYLSFIDEMRCPKCQNQNLAGSDSPIAQDLRRELYRMLKDGRSDKEITDFMVNRYGDYVLYRPQLKKNTYMLWGLPVVLMAVGWLVAFLVVRQRRSKIQAAGEKQSDKDQGRLQDLLDAADKRRNQQ
ncbi:MAG: cytochrome c-type biogenesis protein CcmH [Candidatus Pelagadaptatus aseana]|uniref:cytochrome c-type biogenesis protein n=1 Tax=Candidatus Pelagadaptatus aseana TaxID=3120508 RepID=UPI0039B334B0